MSSNEQTITQVNLDQGISLPSSGKKRTSTVLSLSPSLLYDGLESTDTTESPLTKKYKAERIGNEKKGQSHLVLASSLKDAWAKSCPTRQELSLDFLHVPKSLFGHYSQSIQANSKLLNDKEIFNLFPSSSHSRLADAIAASLYQSARGSTIPTSNIEHLQKYVRAFVQPKPTRPFDTFERSAAANLLPSGHSSFLSRQFPQNLTSQATAKWTAPVENGALLDLLSIRKKELYETFTSQSFLREHSILGKALPPGRAIQIPVIYQKEKAINDILNNSSQFQLNDLSTLSAAEPQRKLSHTQENVLLCLPTRLGTPEDSAKLSNQQVLLRQHIEAFKATEDDVLTHTRGRNKPIMIGQVGIRCRHCAHLSVIQRERGSTYFPASVDGLYQAAQNMNTAHFQSGLCNGMSHDLKQKLINMLSSKSRSSGAGRKYWTEAGKKLGLVNTADGIRFIKDFL